jgi:uncharacterized protein
MTYMHRRIRTAAALVVAALVLTPLQAAPARSFLWKVTLRQGAVYLVGSVHVLKKDFYPLSTALETAYKDADLLVEEVDPAEMLDPNSQMAFLTRGMLPSASSLDKVLSPATYALLNTRLAAAGIPVEPLTLMKPWMVALMIEAVEWQKAGFDAQLGLDMHFSDQAARDGKTVQGLETVEFQISRFDDMSMDQQDHLLAETLKDIDTEQANLTTLLDAWKAGDAPAVERLVLSDLKQEPQLYKRLLVERNQNWLPKLEALFARRGHAFVVVGAAHLVGPDGLIALLKAKGYTVEQL